MSGLGFVLTAVSLAAVHYVQGSDAHPVRSTPAQLAPAHAAAPVTPQAGLTRCEPRRPC
jgi:hypothetical protein